MAYGMTDDFSDLSKENEQLKKYLIEISQIADDTMTIVKVPAKALASIRWIYKLANQALGKDVE